MGARRGNLVLPNKRPNQETHYHDKSHHRHFEYIAGKSTHGTNLALLHFMWMLVSGAFLPNRGAMFLALKSIGLSDAAIRRAWVSFRTGVWQIAEILRVWREQVKTPSSRSTCRTIGLTSNHRPFEVCSSPDKKRVISAWLTCPFTIRERPVAVAYPKVLSK